MSGRCSLDNGFFGFKQENNVSNVQASQEVVQPVKEVEKQEVKEQAITREEVEKIKQVMPVPISNANTEDSVSEQLDKASEIWSYQISADPLVELYALSTDTFRYVGASQANGAVITDSLPVIEWRVNSPTSRNIHFRLEIDTDSAFENSDGRLRIYESKDNPENFEYSTDGGQTWNKFTDTGAASGVQHFRYVFTRNLEVN